MGKALQTRAVQASNSLNGPHISRCGDMHCPFAEIEEEGESPKHIARLHPGGEEDSSQYADEMVLHCTCRCFCWG